MEQVEERFMAEVNAIEKQMLTVEPKYCTRIRHTNSIKFPVPLITPIEREDIPVPDARVFLLHNILTPGECSHYIRETEEICYRDLRSEFEESYRSNERLLVLSQTLADYLWRRMQPHLHRNDVIRVRPMCFGNGGSWLPHRLNECFKFGKYQQKQHFGSHIDGPWVPRADESSIYTVLIYLNDNFEGGETVFTPPSERSKLHQQIAATRESVEAGLKNLSLTSSEATSISESNGGYVIDPSTGRVTIQPRQGTALIFTHDTLHAGVPVLSGTKYVLRTEIMFSRHDSESIPESIREAYHSDPNYQQTVTLYLDSYAKSLKGDVTGFTNSYLAALKLQHEAQFSVSKDTKAIHELNLPLSLYVHLFTFLPMKDLVSSLHCSKSFRDIGKDGSLWKQLYRIQFPGHAPMEEHLQQQQRLKTSPSQPASTSAPSASMKPSVASVDSLDFGAIDPAIQDWYTIFKQRVLLQTEFSPIIFDFGSFTTKCSQVTPTDAPVLELLNLFAVIDGLYNLHCRRGAWQRYYVGLSASSDLTPAGRDRYKKTKHVICAGEPTEIGLLSEVVAACLLKLGVWSHKHPMIIAEPPFGWSVKQRRQISYQMENAFRVPALCFANSAVLTLMSQNLDSGIVAHVGHDTAWVAGIYQRRMIAFYDFTPNMESPNAKFNSIWQLRCNAEGIVPDGTLTSQTQVTPEELAMRSSLLYNYMLLQILLPRITASVHQIVLVGGGTISREFRLRFETAITKANTDRHHSDIGRLRERLIQQASSFLITPINSIQDLTILFPSHPTHTVVEGGKIFGGLSFFKEHCIRSFESVHSSALPLSPWLWTGHYRFLWSTNESFLSTQLLYETIKNHFHRDEELNEYIANTSSSDNEIERICLETDQSNAKRPPNEPEKQPPLVWRRRRRNARPRREHTKSTTLPSSKLTQPTPTVPTTAGPLRPDPNFPLRRARRSAFPILPRSVANWFDQQTYLRSLPTANPTQLGSSEFKDREEKDGSNHSDAEDSSGKFLLKQDMWCPWETESLVGAMLPLYAVSGALRQIRRRFGDQLIPPVHGDDKWEWAIRECQPSKRRAIASEDEEEEECYSDKEEMIEDSTHSFKVKLDQLKAYRASRLTANAFVRQISVPAVDVANLVPIDCSVELVTSIPCGLGGKKNITHHLFERGGLGKLYFTCCQKCDRIEPCALVSYNHEPSMMIDLGILSSWRPHTNSYQFVPLESHASQGATGYLKTKKSLTTATNPSSTSSSTSPTPIPPAAADPVHTFLIRTWNSNPITIDEIEVMYHACIEQAALRNDQTRQQ